MDDGKLLFCVSVNSSKKRLYGPEWKELEGGKTLIDLFLQVCGTDVLGQQVQVLVSKERAFLEAAVVQVYTPLAVLAEKSQSYIQFILKTENSKLEKFFESRKSSSSYESSLERHKTFNVKLADRSFLDSNQTRTTSSSMYTATKPSFADMTVEEICDEIRRIRTKELGKSSLDTSLESKKFESDDSLDKSIEKPATPPIIKRPSSGRLSSAPSKTTPPSLKASLSPAQTRTSKLRSANNAKLGRKSSVESLTNSQQKNGVGKRSPSPASKRSLSPAFKRSPSPVMNKAESYSTPVIKRTPSPVPKRSASPTPKNTSVATTESGKQSESYSKKQQRTPDLVRLSALAKPRRRNSEPTTTTRSSAPMKKSCNPIRKASMRSKSPRLSTIKSKFTRPEASNKRDTNSKANDYFVEIFTPTTEGNVDSPTHCKKSDEYSSDSLLIDNGHSKTNDSLLVGDVLAEIRNVENMSLYEYDNPIKDEKGAEMPSPTTLDEDKEDGFITMTIDSKFEEKCSKSEVSASLKKFFFTPPPKSPLFSPLLEKIKQSSTLSSTEKQNKSYFVFSGERKGNFNKDSGHTRKTSPCNHSSLSLSGDIPIDSLSFSMSSKNSDTCEHDNTNEETWANSRGIKFTGTPATTTKAAGKKKSALNDTFTINGKLTSSRSISGRSQTSSFELKEDSEEKSSCPPQTAVSSTPLPDVDDSANTSIMQHERKHWSNTLKGMDDLVVASLKAFSCELRTTSETVASNIKILYERWRCDVEGIKNESGEERSTSNSTLGLNKLTPRSTPPEEGANIQQNIAYVFRNLRKIEVKLKTIEQATFTMLKTNSQTLEVPPINQNDQQDVETKRPSLHRSKSFKWNELKHSAREQSKGSLSWRSLHRNEDEGRGDTSSSSDSDEC